MSPTLILPNERTVLKIVHFIILTKYEANLSWQQRVQYKDKWSEFGEKGVENAENREILVSGTLLLDHTAKKLFAELELEQ